MDHFNFRQQHLYAEELPVADLAKEHGTPLYIYSRATLERHFQVFNQAFGDHPHDICYAVKANSNIAILNVLARMGAGFDIVSVGELERVLVAGGDPSKVVFSGVGKLDHEIRRALEVGVGCFNIESRPELEHISQIASDIGKTANISIRVNPNIDAGTHPYISTGLKENKFGIDILEAPALYDLAAKLPGINVVGIACHIGSQLTELQPFLDAFEKVHDLFLNLNQRGFNLTRMDCGGGLGVRYLAENPPSPAEYVAALLKRLKDDKIHLTLEPGRAIAANAGILVTQVAYLKETSHKNFAIVDAAMNDLLRPALYHAEQDIIPVVDNDRSALESYDVVGPVCETGDFLGKDRLLAIKPKDFLAIRTAGAYGFTMSSNYNSRPRAAEIMVDGDQVHLIRERETIAQLFAGEKLIGT
jgi:diaminopimelate decarboxylase